MRIAGQGRWGGVKWVVMSTRPVTEGCRRGVHTVDVGAECILGMLLQLEDGQQRCDLNLGA